MKIVPMWSLFSKSVYTGSLRYIEKQKYTCVRIVAKYENLTGKI